MYTIGGPVDEEPARESGVRAGPCRSVGAVPHYACAVTSLLVTGVVLLVGYPVLVALTRPLYVLSSTALVFAVLSLWLGLWATFELTWVWRARHA